MTNDLAPVQVRIKYTPSKIIVKYSGTILDGFFHPMAQCWYYPLPQDLWLDCLLPIRAAEWQYLCLIRPKKSATQSDGWWETANCGVGVLGWAMMQKHGFNWKGLLG